MNEGPLLSIIIVNWNSKDYLFDCLCSIYKKKYPFGVEVVVLDNCSTDMSAEMIEESFPDVKLIKSQVNIGFAKGNEEASKVATGAYCLFCNPDVVVFEDCLEALLFVAKGIQGLGAIGCRVLNADGSIQKTCARHLPKLRRRFFDEVLLHNCWPQAFHGMGEYYNEKEYENTRPVECLSGCFLLVPHSVLKEVGGFSTSYFMYAEDIEFCLRLQKAGLKIYYTRAASIIHYGGKSSSQRKESWFSVIQRNNADLKFFRENHGILPALSFRIIILLGSVLRLLVSPLFLRKTAAKHSPVSASKQMATIRWALTLK
jgi:N-acetylglucosaminyl-diphospho-decaprenol L-rhamnosyltransferase